MRRSAVQMEKMCGEASEAVRLMDELSKCTNPAAIPDLLDRIKLASLDAPMLAFEGQDDADRKWLATTFADEWAGCMGALVQVLLHVRARVQVAWH